ncbi:hypothetical protein M3Y99_01729800 [Aphelenchoides fujianensis]|nr:hypothetical protein M3Y99_01729800 [Aphelenchoides fujianensis]
MRVANSTTRRMIAAVALLSIAVLPAAFGEEAPSVPSRPRALAAPTGFNAIDVGGQSKDFLKLPGGYRDGFQKVIFEEVGPANQPALPDAPSADHFGAYDDNSTAPPPPPPTAAPRAPLGGLRTGVCARTIYYKPQEASATEIAQVYSHFAVVVSVDQCARTCHEFNCAQALFDPTNRHCQFNPGTIRSQPQSCEAWPNPLYRNNVPITSRPLLLRCVTCQARRRNPLRPFQRQNARAFGLAQSLSESPIQRSTLARRIHGVMIKENITRTTDVERLLRKSAEAEKIVQMGGGGSAEAPSIALLPERPSVDAMTDDEKPPQSEAAPLADAPEAPRKNVHTTDLEIKPADGPKSAEQPKERADAPVDSGTDEQTAGFLVATLPKGGGVRVHRLDQRRLEDDAGSD